METSLERHDLTFKNIDLYVATKFAGVYKIEWLLIPPTAQSVVQKSDINAPGKSPNVPGKKKFEYV